MTTAVKTEEAVLVHDKASPLRVLGQRFAIEPAKLVDVLRGTVIKPDRNGKQATNEEVAAFCIVANQYGLNPFTREIHAFTSGDKGVVPIVGIDGWTHIVNQREDFNGCEFSEASAQDGSPLSVSCAMYVKGREHPVCVTERYSECKRQTIPWQTMPWRMLRHKAYMQAARYAFGLSGIYDEDEARDIAAAARDITGGVEVKPATAAPQRRIADRLAGKPEPQPQPQEPEPAPAADPLEAERVSKIAALKSWRKGRKEAWAAALVSLDMAPIPDAEMDALTLDAATALAEAMRAQQG